jgi:hypothetical protein
MAKDLAGTQISFFSENDEFYSRSVSDEEFETALMCVLNNVKQEDLPIFKLGYCDKRNYIRKFWHYFTVGSYEPYDVTCHVGLFITAFRVIGYDVNTFCERLVSKEDGRAKRKRCVEYVYDRDEDA